MAARVVRVVVGRVEAAPVVRAVRAVRAAMVLEHAAHVGEPKGPQAADVRAVAIVLVDPIELVLPHVLAELVGKTDRG